MVFLDSPECDFHCIQEPFNEWLLNGYPELVGCLGNVTLSGPAGFTVFKCHARLMVQTAEQPYQLLIYSLPIRIVLEKVCCSIAEKMH